MCLLQSLTLFKITKEYDNTRDYSMRSFYTGLLNVRHSPFLILLTLDIRSCMFYESFIHMLWLIIMVGT